MKKFRRTVAGLLVGTMLLSMAGCGSPDPDDYEYGKSLEQLTEEEVVIAGGGTGESSGGGLLNPGSLSGDPKEFEGDFEPVQYSDTENKEFEEFILLGINFLLYVARVDITDGHQDKSHKRCYH